MRFVFFALAALLSMAAAASCPAPADVTQAELLGTWRATIEGSTAVTLQLAKDPEFAETVRGHLERDGQRVELAGDVDDGDLTLEESVNGRNISATWLGEVVDGSCGRMIRGAWKAEGSGAERAFVLEKQAP